MTFEEDNEYFKPNILEVTLDYPEEDQVIEIKGTEITWMEGQDPTKKKIKKKQKHKKTGETRTVVKTVAAESFFNNFASMMNPHVENGGEDSESDDDDHDKFDLIQQTVEDIHDILMPEALDYYLGFNDEFDMLDMEDDSDDKGSDSNSDGDSKPKKKKGKEGDASTAPGAEGQ